MTKYCGRSVSGALYDSYSDLFINGDKSTSRNGGVKQLHEVEFSFRDVSKRLVNLKGRKNSLATTLTEIFWVFGDDKSFLDPVMTTVLPRSKNFSDDGLSWRAGYGKRLLTPYNQIVEVVNQLKVSRDSRRCVLSIWDRKEDALDLETKDFPCNNFAYVWIHKDKLHLKVFQRGGDAVWGIGNINLMEFSFLSEIILSLYNHGEDDKLKGVVYSHYVNNYHVYEFTEEQVRDVVVVNKVENESLIIYTDCLESYPLIISNYDVMYSIYNHLCKVVLGKSDTSLEAIFNKYEISTRNSLYEYAKISEAYLLGKSKSISQRDNTRIKGMLPRTLLSPYTLACLANNKLSMKYIELV